MCVYVCVAQIKPNMFCVCLFLHVLASCSYILLTNILLLRKRSQICYKSSPLCFILSAEVLVEGMPMFFYVKNLFLIFFMFIQYKH